MSPAMLSDHLCECGCGGRTTIIQRNDLARGRVAGQPNARIYGHWKGGLQVPPHDPIRVAWRTTASGCWEWTGRFDSKGYGLAGRERAHRWVYELLVRALPRGVHLHHRCENPACVRPAHLRFMRPRDHHREHRTLDMAKAHEIRLLAASDPSLTQAGIGAMYGVSQTCIGQVLRGRTWAG